MNQESHERWENVQANAKINREYGKKTIDGIIKDESEHELDQAIRAAAEAAGGNENSPLYIELKKTIRENLHRFFNQPVSRPEIEGMPQQIEGETIPLKEEVVNDAAKDCANSIKENFDETLVSRVKEKSSQYILEQINRLLAN